MMFLRRAGTMILASMVLVWVLLNFPARDYPEQIAELDEPVKELREELQKKEESIADQRNTARVDRQEKSARGEQLADIRRKARLTDEIAPAMEEIEPLKEKLEPADEQINALQLEWKRAELPRPDSAGRIEPAVRPAGLGLADRRRRAGELPGARGRRQHAGHRLPARARSIPRRSAAAASPRRAAPTSARRSATPAGPTTRTGRCSPIASALSLMVFFALCCQCASTLAVIRRETRSWAWPAFTFVYMTVLAYVAALVVFQIGRLF